jgi:hypothetical protein
MFVFFNNPQITNAQIINLSKFKIKNFFKLSMLVGISEAIRLLLTFSINLNFKKYKDFMNPENKYSSIINLVLEKYSNNKENNENPYPFLE